MHAYGPTLIGFYDYRLVVLSVFIGVLAAFAALDLAGRVTTAHGAARLVWLGCGSVAMGTGIWAMHYVGMEAFQLPVPVEYDWPTVLLSLLAAIFASAVALFIASRPAMGILPTTLGSVFMGGGISAMHYIGMEAMRLPAMCVYSAALVILSVVLAIAVSCVAMQLIFTLRTASTFWDWRRVVGGLIMGLSIPVMHYVGMAAVHFISMPLMEGSMAHAISVSDLSLSGIAIAALVILGLVFVTSTAAKQFAQQTLRADEANMQLQTIFDHMKEAIVVVDRDRNIIHNNRAAKYLLGLPDGTITRKEIASGFELSLPDGTKLPWEQWPTIKALQGDFIENQEFLLRRKDNGKTTIAEISTAPIPTPTGEITRIILSYRDVNERRQMDETKAKLVEQSRLFTESRLQLQAVFDTMTEAIVVVDCEHRTVQHNRAASELLGLGLHRVSLQELADTFEAYSPAGELLRPEDWPVARAIQGEFCKDSEVIIRRKGSDASINVEMTTVPITTQQDDSRKIIVSLRDIKERKLMDEARSRLVAIVEYSEDAIIGKDAQGLVTSWNGGAERIFGYRSDEMMGHSVVRLLPVGHEHEEDEILQRIKRGETVEHLESLRRRKDGTIIQISLTISPIRDASGVVVGASKIARDITEKKHLELQLQQSQKMDAIGQLTGGIAHDFNNLLGIILGNLDLLEDFAASSEAATSRVQAAQRAAARGADLTRRLLAFARMGGLKPSSTSLNSSIENMIAMAARALGPEISITTLFDDSLPHVFVDAAGLESALLNLVVNARDAMPKGGSISISTRLIYVEGPSTPEATGQLTPGWYACASMTDTGQGMPKDTLARAFEPFFTTKQRDKGTGLGLAMVHGFVTQSGGSVRLYSEPGIGTTVSIYLPLVAEDSQTKSAITEEDLSKRLSALVLIVDDETDLLMIAGKYLEDMGCTILQAVDGASALKILEQDKQIDLMVTDIIMPGGMNGVELAQRAHELRPSIKVVYSSGFPADSLAERKMPLLDGPLLRKPYQRAELRAVVSTVLEGRNTRLDEEKCVQP